MKIGPCFAGEYLARELLPCQWPTDFRPSQLQQLTQDEDAPMCAGDDHNCPQFELHRQKLLDDLDAERRTFLKSAFVATGGAAALGATGGSLISPAAAQSAAPRPGKPTYHYLPATADTVHWGYFSKLLKPQLEVDSGDYVTIEALTHHANDDAERMIKGDPGAESVYLWTKDKKAVNRRGAGPVDGKLLGRGSGEGFGVHICTGPVYVRGAEAGDILEVRIMDVKPRPCANPAYPGKSFGSNAAAWWGFHYKELLTEPKPREVITIYEIDTSGQRNWAQAVYNFQWTPQADPFGVVHKTIDYPGVPVDHGTIKENHGVLKNVRIPIRPHFGVMGVTPNEADYVDSIPPGYFGGNMDNWRVGKGATMYYPVAVPGALFSIGDSHASQGDSELCGTAIECSLTGTFQLVLHKQNTLSGSLAELNYPLLETQDEWVLHGFSFANYLAELGPKAQSDIYEKSSIDLALKDAFRKMRAFLMKTKGLTEDEAISLISIAVDFGVTQVVDGNWGIHAIIKKNLFAGATV
jgi:acetamidase/formamidase